MLASDISFVVLLGLVGRFARGEIVDIRQSLVRRIVVERERAAGVLQRNGSAWPFRFLLFRLGVRTALRFGVGTEIARAARCRRRERVESRWTAEAAASGTG